MKLKIKKSKVDILNLEWVSDGRDTHIIEPVLISLEERYGYSVKRSSVWGALYKLLWYRPRVFVMSNDNGAENNVKIFHFANLLGIYTVTLISEGLHHIVKDEIGDRQLTEDIMWSHNTKKEVYWDLKIIWSNRLLYDFQRWIPETDLKKVCVCGATGFDRYKLFAKSNIDLIRKLNIKESRIVLVAGWGFDAAKKCIEQIDGREYYKDVAKIFCQRDSVKEIYKTMIEENPNVAFILKYHPGTFDKSETEFYGLEEYSNVYPLKNEIEMSQLIRESDLLIAFESTTAIEAWLLNKMVFFVNPLGTDFMRQDMYKGTVIIDSTDKMRYMFSKFLNAELIEEYEMKADIRNQIIKNNIEYDDGFNYLRTAKTINDYWVKSERKKKNVNILTCVEMLKELLYETAVFFVGHTPIGWFFPSRRAFYRKRESLYITANRNEICKQYRHAIRLYEHDNIDRVNAILSQFDCWKG